MLFTNVFLVFILSNLDGVCVQSGKKAHKGDFEEQAIQLLTEIMQRCEEREKNGQPKFPRRSFNPRTHASKLENKDALDMHKINKWFTEGFALPDGKAAELWKELLSWDNRDSPDSSEVIAQRQNAKVEEMIKRLLAIKERGVRRGCCGRNMYPKRSVKADSYEKVQNQDSRYISSLKANPPEDPRALELLNEILAWNEKSAQGHDEYGQFAKVQRLGEVPKKEAPHKSNYHGVHWDKEAGKWRASRRNGGHYFHGGFFDNEIDAAKRSDELVREKKILHGQLNFPTEEDPPVVPVTPLTRQYSSESLAELPGPSDAQIDQQLDDFYDHPDQRVGSSPNHSFSGIVVLFFIISLFTFLTFIVAACVLCLYGKLCFSDVYRMKDIYNHQGYAEL